MNKKLNSKFITFLESQLNSQLYQAHGQLSNGTMKALLEKMDNPLFDQLKTKLRVPLNNQRFMQLKKTIYAKKLDSKITRGKISAYLSNHLVPKHDSHLESRIRRKYEEKVLSTFKNQVGSRLYNNLNIQLVNQFKEIK